MTDDELLEKVCDFSDRWSKPLLTGIGGYMLSAVVIAWNVTDWIVDNARDNLGALIAFGIGGVLTGVVLASLFWRHVVKRALKAKDAAVAKRISSELADTDGFEQVDSLDALVEKARGLSSLQNENTRLMEDNLSLQKQLAQVNDYWKSQIARTQADVSAKNAELEREKSIHERELAAKEAEIAELKTSEANHWREDQIEPDQTRTPSGKLCTNMAAVKTLPTETIEAMLDAFDNGGGMRFEGHERAVRESVKRGDGIFVIGRMYFMGYQGEENGTFSLTKEWRDFMDDHKVIAEIREIIRSAGPVWHEI